MLFQGVMTGFVTSVLKKVVEDLFKSCKRKNAVSVPMARHVKTTAEATVTRNENGLARKCGSNCKPGINMNAGKVIRLKIPKTMIKERILHVSMDE